MAVQWVARRVEMKDYYLVDVRAEQTASLMVVLMAGNWVDC